MFCAPSLHGESFGVVLLEAMAAGTPVIASAIEGYRNVARADRDALLVPPGDVDALRDALRRVFDDPALRDRLVAAGRERAEEFSMARLAERYLELYERASLVPARDGTDPTIERLALDLAARVRDAVAPSLGRSRRARTASASRPAATSRWRSTRSPSR